MTRERILNDFEVNGTGWADVKLCIGPKIFVLDSVSYGTDALGDLARTALLIVTGAREVTIRFDREPAEWRLVFQSLFDTVSGAGPLSIRVLEFASSFQNEPDQNGKEVFTADCDALAFAAAVLETAMACERQYAEFSAGFHPYPSVAIAALKVALVVRDTKIDQPDD